MAPADGESLQDRFMRFRKQRAKAMRAKQERAAKERADPEFKNKLRQKFLDTAMKYIGVVRPSVAGLHALCTYSPTVHSPCCP